MYAIGEYIEDDIDEALKIYNLLINNTESVGVRSFAKFVLGDIYYEGRINGVNIVEDKEKGLRLIKEAAEEGEEKAIKFLQEREEENE